MMKNLVESNSWATALLPIGNGFMYIETSSNNHGPNVFSVVLNEQIMNKLLILHSTITDFQL